MTRDKKQDLGHPEDLPDWAVGHWPDLNSWPTPRHVDSFVRGTRRQPEVRLAVLSGLRSWEVVDLSPAWAWVGSVIALVSIGIAVLASQIVWAPIVVAAAVVAMGLIALTPLINLHGAADLRRRRAHVWLRAFEDAIRR